MSYDKCKYITNKSWITIQKNKQFMPTNFIEISLIRASIVCFKSATSSKVSVALRTLFCFFSFCEFIFCTACFTTLQVCSNVN